MADNSRLVVLGPPGSGKSMILKHIALTYAEQGLYFLRRQPIPVLLELHRLNDPTLSLEQRVVEEFSRNNFPNAEGFVKYSLRKGSLLLLLDGYDEVNTSERARVVQQVKDLLSEHGECSALITCRGAVYRGEFAEGATQTLEIVDFDDQQVQRFLASWATDMPPDKSVEQLTQTLRDRPRIMALARNPLLLTIIAYLYTDTPYVLPHSRAEFYKQSTDILLRQWHQERNQYEARDKRLVLEHLALFNQDQSVQPAQDRRSMEYQVVLHEVKKILPSLNLHPERDSSPLLSEIVERSGLLLSIDGGQRYQFAHLTLQEFFAASELTDDAKGLNTRFARDNDVWRETVKLWCGLSGDAGALIKGVYADDPVTAFECLAEAQRVDQGLAERIVDEFKARLGNGADQELITAAFGAVAADLRPRGRAVFEFLARSLRAGTDEGRRIGAASALSLTNLPEAARILSAHYKEYSKVRPYLVRMGDLAVHSLMSLAESGSFDALDDLLAIGTPRAAEALVSELWHTNTVIAGRAAWRVAILLAQPNIESALRDYPLTAQQRSAESLTWVWEPFGEPINSSLPVIAGRVALLLTLATPVAIAPRDFHTIDERIAVALIAVHGALEWKRLGTKDWLEWEKEHRSGVGITQTNLFTKSLSEILQRMGASELTRHLMLHIQPRLAFDIVSRMAQSKDSPTRADWASIFRPVRYALESSWHYRVILFLSAAISLVAISQMITTILRLPEIVSMAAVLPALGVVCVLGSWNTFVRGPSWMDRWDPELLLMVPLGPIIFGIVLPVALMYEERKKDRGATTMDFAGFLVVFIPFIGCSPAIGYYATAALRTALPFWEIVILWVIFLGIWGGLFFRGFRLRRAARNPLEGIFHPKPHGWPSRLRAELYRLGRGAGRKQP